MKTAKERARLKELFSLNILDTPSEERFDRHTRLVSEIFNMPTAIISLIDEDRQWFKSATGMDLTETPLEQSVCLSALDEGFLEIPDLLEDEYFKDHAAVHASDPPLRFYAGAVLYGPKGHPIGTLCLNDYVPRKLSARERSWLKSFSRLVQDEINRDVELEHERRQIREATLRDTTTGLPGDVMFIETLDSLIRTTSAESRNLAVLQVRMDNLDTLFRLHGEETLETIVRMLAERLTAPNDRILAAARMGQERFSLVVPVDSLNTMLSVARRVLAKLSEPVQVDRHLLRAEISIGTSMYPLDGNTAEELIDRAWRAFSYRQVHERIYIYDHEEDLMVTRRHLIEQRLEQALSTDQLFLNYQPIFAADGSDVVSFEALARWHDEKLGKVSPGEFIPIAERSSRLSYLLTCSVLRMACARAREWRANVGGKPVRVAVNIPAREFYSPGFVEMILGILRETDTDPSRLILELTEESLMQDVDRTVSTMAALSKRGVKLALDDFGTGYSSLSLLRRLPVDTLKIDKSFIDGIPEQQGAVELVSGIIAIAQGMGLSLVAEGVETEGQRAVLEGINCDMIQGFLLGRPVAAEKVSDVMDSLFREPEGVLE
jgi:diguanylate cyclase (GGDEF)-like protein